MTTETFITEQPLCCSLTLKDDFNCAENYCEFSLCNWAKMWYLCGCCSKYYTVDVNKADKQAKCGFNDCNGCFIPELILCPFALVTDILCSPCKTFLYCEKCIEKK